MVGIPNNLLTKKDYYNAVDYVISTGDGKSVLIARLNNLKANITINVLKETSAGKDAEELTADDFQPESDPNCELNRLQFTEAEVDSLIGRLV